jgi:hypothetical protein
MGLIRMTKFSAVVLLCISFASRCGAQAKPAHPAATTDPDQLGQTCAQILQMTSNDWIVYFGNKTGLAVLNNPSPLLRAISVYGKCYDGRTNRLAASLGKSGKGPLMGATGNFRDFQSAVDTFTAKSLAAIKASENSQQAAYSHLYEKQFRYQFYQGYADKNPKGRPLTPEESDEFAKAKNRFGEVLGLLPDDSMHAVHSSFRQIFDSGTVSDLTKLELYRYAIDLLAPAKDKPFSPPPF